MKKFGGVAMAILFAVVAVVWAGGASARRSTPPAVPTAPPTEIPITVPLPKAPPRGKTVGFVLCNVPTCATFVPGMKAAAAALGWKVELFTYTGANAKAALIQAVQKRVDYIAITGAGRAVYAAGLAMAHAKHIPVLSQSATDPADPKAGLYAQIGGTSTYNRYTVVMANWGARDSGGKANVVFVNIPDFPILATGEKQARAAWKAACASCGFDLLEVTVDDLGAGTVGSKVVAYLQSHPNVNYVEFSFGDLITGVPEAIQSAGLSNKVKLITVSATGQVFKGIIDGTVAAGNVQPNSYMGWVHIDRMARLSLKLPLAQNAVAQTLPTYVVDSAAQAKPLVALGYWDGPKGYQAAFKKLWHVK
jgi:ABC-type sugar transport system substrate-binding protein